MSRQTENRAIVQTPVDTGLLRGSHGREVFVEGTRAVGVVYNTAEYVLPVHEGWQRTAPIVPVNGRALRFRINGRVVIVARVNTPASYAGRPWLWLSLVEVATPYGFIVTRY